MRARGTGSPVLYRVHLHLLYTQDAGDGSVTSAWWPCPGGRCSLAAQCQMLSCMLRQQVAGCLGDEADCVSRAQGMQLIELLAACCELY